MNMANLVRWEPFNEIVSLREAMDKLFEDSFIHTRWLTPMRENFMGQMALDIVENADELVVKASVPGFKPEDIDIAVVDDTLTIKAESKAEKKEEKETYLLRERRYNAMQRSVRLPVTVEADKATAEFEQGVLTLTLPKAEAVKPKQIKINAKK
jgi:HSP20 family protein